MKKLFVTLIMLVLATSTFAYDFSAVCDSGQILYYSIINNLKVEVVRPTSNWNGYSQPTGDLIIPDSVEYAGNYYTVVSISGSTFMNCTELTSVVIPNSITIIGDHAFANDSTLVSAILPNRLTSIEGLTFSSCTSLTTVTLPDSLLLIKGKAFQYCESLSSIVFPNTLESIAYDAFYYCTSLSGDLVLPSSLHSLGSSCFEGCSSLSGILLPESLVSLGSSCFESCSSLSGELVLPESLVSLGSYCFAYCSGLTGIVFPENIPTIPMSVFEGCSGLTGNLVIPDQCTFIDGMAFYGCSSLTSLTIGAAVDTIRWGAFKNCTGLESITCKTPTPPYGQHIQNIYYEDHGLFENVPTDIPVYVNCLTIDQYHLNQDWSQFTNMQGVFYGTPELYVSVNNTEYGTAEVVSIPEDCDQLTATVRATPNPGHTFGYWKCGTIVSFDQEYTFTLRHNTTLTAYFDCLAIIDDEIAFPDHIVGRKFNASGQVTGEYPSDFIYDQDGIMKRLEFPALCTCTFTFDDYPTMPKRIVYMFDAGHPIYDDRYLFTYENNRIKHTEVTLGLEEFLIHYDYFYDDNWHLTKKTYQRYWMDMTDGSECNTYSYEDNYRTKIDSLFSGYDTLIFKRRTTNHYNERQQILSSQIDTYNDAGNITSRKLNTYSYTSNNKTDSIIAQTLTDGEWVNSGLTHYVYDDKNRVVEYQTGSWSAENEDWNINHKIIYDFHDEEQKLIVSFKKKSNGEWIWDSFSGQTIFYESELYEWQRAISNYKSFYINQFEIDLHYVTKEIEFPWQSEWYYEIVWDDGSTTYQHLEYASDTTIGTSRPKVIVRSNTHYDRDTINEVTHEYILEENGIVYWWNNTLQEFTTLYDYNAETGDEWEIKVGTESIMVHVDNVDVFEYLGETFKMLQISDANDIFSGDIVVGFGHMTSFFPEKLMNQGKGFRVDGLRCYCVEDALLYHNGNEDCDAIHSELQDIEEHPSKTAFAVYPNPTNNILFVETVHAPSLPEETQYRITNLMGQTLLKGHITDETQQVDIADLPSGMYFISVGEQTVKFVKQ